MMKLTKRTIYRICLFALIAMAMMSLSACSLMDLMMRDPVSDALLEQAMSNIEKGDRTAFLSMFNTSLIEIQENNETADMLFDALKAPMKDHKIIGRFLKMQAQGGQSIQYVECNYRATVGDELYLISLQRSTDDSDPRLYSFYAEPYDQYQQSMPTGIIGQFEDWNWQQWGLLAYTVSCCIFVLWTLIHCIRHKMRKKWLFILLILWHVGAVIVFVGGQVAVQSWRIWFLSESSLLQYQNGAMQLTVNLPIGAILYWFIKKKPPVDRRNTTTDGDEMLMEVAGENDHGDSDEERSSD